jgi:hypothetical protein
MKLGVAESLKLVFLVLLVSGFVGQAVYGSLSAGDRLVGTIDSGAEGLEIVLPNSGSCCGEAMSEVGGSPVKIYLASEPTGGASMLVYLGRDDRTILMEASGANGHYDRELFRSAPGLRTPEGELTMRVPPGVLPAGTLRLWSGGSPARTAVTGLVPETS